MVSNSALSAVCVTTGLFEYIQLSGGNVRLAISNYAKKVRALRDEEYKRALSESRLPGQFWLEAEPPKVCFCILSKPQATDLFRQVLSDVLEALLGAIRLERGGRGVLQHLDAGSELLQGFGQWFHGFLRCLVDETNVRTTCRSSNPRKPQSSRARQVGRSTWASWVRELTPSFTKIFRRWYSTVLVEM